jgi:hypothetical protein
VVPVLVGGADGPFPFPAVGLAGVVLFCVLSWLLAPSGGRALRCFAVAYLAVAILLFFVPTPIGGNVARLGKLIALPMAVRFLSFGVGIRRRAGASAVVAAAAIWAFVPFVSSAVHGAADPSRDSSYYTGLNRFLRTEDPDRGRLEIPFTREHWESYWVAKQFPIARGWERQTDLLYNQVLYRPLTAAQYLRWLRENAVSLVALPNVPIDYGGRAEARLLAHPPPYLTPVWHDRNWQVWRVRGQNALVQGVAVLSDLDAASMTLTFPRAATVVVKVRADGLWHVRSGAGCIAATPGSGWLVVRAQRAGQVNLAAGLSTTSDECT